MSLGDVGAFASGFGGGLGIGMKIKDMKTQKAATASPENTPGAPQQGTETGFGLGQNVVSGDINAPTYASSTDDKSKSDDSSGPWSMLQGLLGGTVGGSMIGGDDNKIPGIAGSLLSGGTKSMGIGGALLGKLFK